MRCDGQRSAVHRASQRAAWAHAACCVFRHGKVDAGRWGAGAARPIRWQTLCRLPPLLPDAVRRVGRNLCRGSAALLCLAVVRAWRACICGPAFHDERRLLYQDGASLPYIYTWCELAAAQHGCCAHALAGGGIYVLVVVAAVCLDALHGGVERGGHLG